MTTEEARALDNAVYNAAYSAILRQLLHNVNTRQIDVYPAIVDAQERVQSIVQDAFDRASYHASDIASDYCAHHAQ